MFAECFLGTLGVVCGIATPTLLAFAVAVIASAFRLWRDSDDDGGDEGR